MISETMGQLQIDWQEEEEADEEEQEGNRTSPGMPSAILRRLIRWGWLKSDYDERWNIYMLSFPEYSSLYVELFYKLRKEDDSGERESILSVYSALFTYHSDSEKNNEILNGALRTSRKLEQLLTNMQNGMRSYFDELSQSKNFLAIQQVLVDEINNSDSKRYAILTTTDSFYRYKEAVKELISQIVSDNEKYKRELLLRQKKEQPDAMSYRRIEQALKCEEEATAMVYQIEREFDMIERKYNKLIEQKALFARRALARIRYIFQEGTHDEDNILKLLNLLDTGAHKDELLENLSRRISLSLSYKIFNDNSMYKRHENVEAEFTPVQKSVQLEEKQAEITDFVPRPLYTKKQLYAFRDKNTKDGIFTVTKETVSSIEDLEKMMFLWQETVQNQGSRVNVSIGKELKNERGFTFSALTIQQKED